MRDALAKKYIRGRGIEIGGLHCPLPVPPGARVIYIDRLPPGEAHPDVKTVVHEVVIDDAETLRTVIPGSCDFVIANHVLEHCHDPIGTLNAWRRSLVVGGIIYAAVPEKTQTFDAPRAVTTLQHVIDDHVLGTHDGRDAEHYHEWLRIIDKIQEPERSKLVAHCLETRANIHFHVWDRPAMRELLDWVCPRVGLELLEFAENGAEVIWILRKLP